MIGKYHEEKRSIYVPFKSSMYQRPNEKKKKKITKGTDISHILTTYYNGEGGKERKKDIQVTLH
jgi:hypothetical protein